MRLYIFIFYMFLLPPCAFSQHKKFLELKNEKINYSPKHYFINNVFNDQQKKVFVGWMSGDKLELKNGAVNSFRSFIFTNVRQNKTGQPIILHITKIYCEITRKNSQWKINSEMKLAFYAGDMVLIEFTGTANAMTGKDPTGYLSSILKKQLVNDLKQFDDWWIENKGRIPLSADVKVNVSLGRTSEKPDQIIYSTQRPLQISDFQGPYGSNPSEAAATVSGIGMRYHSEAQNSQMVADVIVYPYFKISESWFRKSDQNQRVLAHEQTHFDITALYACKLLNAIRATKMTKENYDRLLDELQKQTEDKTEKEEDRYDNETNHGTIKDKQEQWQVRLKEEIRKCGCY